SPAAVVFIDINAQDRRQQVANVLAGVQAVGDAAAVAGREVEVAVWSEADAAAVVTSRGPLHEDALGLRIGLGRGFPVDLETRQVTAVGLLLLRLDGSDIEETVLRELGVHHHAIYSAPDIDEQLLAGLLRVGGNRVDLAAPFGDDPAVHPRHGGQ